MDDRRAGPALAGRARGGERARRVRLVPRRAVLHRLQQAPRRGLRGPAAALDLPDGGDELPARRLHLRDPFGARPRVGPVHGGALPARSPNGRRARGDGHRLSLLPLVAALRRLPLLLLDEQPRHPPLAAGGVRPARRGRARHPRRVALARPDHRRGQAQQDQHPMARRGHRRGRRPHRHARPAQARRPVRGGATRAPHLPAVRPLERSARVPAPGVHAQRHGREVLLPHAPALPCGHVPQHEPVHLPGLPAGPRMVPLRPRGNGSAPWAWRS